MNRNNYIDKIIFLVRAKMLTSIPLELDKDKMLNKMEKICKQVFEAERKTKEK